MLVDARTLTEASVIRSDICIVGAGPAGVAIATELTKSGLKVAILESGPLDEDRAELGQPAESTVFPDNMGLWTTRQFGGNANRWHVNAGAGPNYLRLMPLSVADMEKRPGMADSGWPIGRADLDPYYARTQRWFELSDRGYAGAQWADAKAPELALEGTGLQTAMYQFADRHVVTHRYRALLEASENITVYYNATASRIDTDEGGEKVTRVRALSAPGQTIDFIADTFVLALGGLATPQLLLASNEQQEAGVGNANDVVGRYFMDHPLLFGGTFVPSDRKLIDAMALYDLRRIDDLSAMAHLQLTDAALRTQPIAHISGMLYPRRAMSKRREAGFEASQRLRIAVRKKEAWSPRDLFTMALGIDGVGQQFYDRLFSPIANVGVGGWTDKSDPAERFTHFEVLHQAEQAPHHDNVVRLSDERDPLGQRRVEINWRWHDEDREMVVRAQDVMAESIRKAGLGEFRIKRPFEIKTSSTTHFMGSARMHADAKKGVVDANLQVHGMRNLFISGSSVFTSGGYANPTLTIVALSLRLADHLKGVHGSVASVGAKAMAEV